MPGLRDASEGTLGATQAFTLAQNRPAGAMEVDGTTQSTDAAAMMLAEFDLEGACTRNREAIIPRCASLELTTIPSCITRAVRNQVERMRTVVHRLAVSMENTFTVQLLKMPRNVRNLNMGEFCNKYAGEVKQVVDEQFRKVVDDMAQEEDASQVLSAQRYNTMSRCALPARCVG